MRNLSRVPALAAGLALLTALGTVSAHAAVQTRGFRQAFPAGAEVRLFAQWVVEQARDTREAIGG